MFFESIYNLATMFFCLILYSFSPSILNPYSESGKEDTSSPTEPEDLDRSLVFDPMTLLKEEFGLPGEDEEDQIEPSEEDDVLDDDEDDGITFIESDPEDLVSKFPEDWFEPILKEEEVDETEEPDEDITFAKEIFEDLDLPMAFQVLF